MDTTFSCPCCWSLILFSEAPEKNSGTVVLGDRSEPGTRPWIHKHTHTHSAKWRPGVPVWQPHSCPTSLVIPLWAFSCIVMHSEKVLLFHFVASCDHQLCFWIICACWGYSCQSVSTQSRISFSPRPVCWLPPSNGDRVSLCLLGSTVCTMCVSAAARPAPMCVRPGYVMMNVNSRARKGLLIQTLPS